MDIYPQNLSPQIRAQVLRAQRYIWWRRISSGSLIFPTGDGLSETMEVPVWNSVFMQGFFGFALGVMVGASALPNDVFFHSTGLFDLSLFGSGGTLIGLGIGYAGRWKSNRLESGRTQGTKITQTELSMVSKNETDALKQDYLGIVQTLISVPSPQDTAAARSLRNTLRLLGETIEGLPALSEQSLFLDPIALSDEARALTEKAHTETDGIIVASLQRQVLAVTRRAETITRAAVLTRRNQALRAEVIAQVKAIQTSLAAGQVNGSQGSSDFTALAEQVVQMAQEANALADAHAELDAALVGNYKTSSEKPAIEIAAV